MKGDDRIENVTKIWQLYEKGVAQHQRMGLDSDVEMAYRFYEGDQWHGLESKERLPVYNFIAPTVKYKVANTAMNQMQIYFTAVGQSERAQELARVLSDKAALWWERLGMERICWQMLKESAIAGESYLYFYDETGGCQILDNTNVFLGDEGQRDVQKQPYILLYERRDVAQVQEMARRMGVEEQEVRRIVSDGARRPATPAQTDDGKCTLLLYMTRRGEDLYFVRCTRYVQLGEQQCIPGLDCYPLVALVTGQKKGSARGRGEVRPLIANQIEVNRNLVRRILNAKLTAFSRLVYATDKIENPECLSEVGSAIAVNDSTIADIHSAVGYVSPSPMSGDAKIISDELITLSRELAGAGDALTGNIDPTAASGTAIIAVRDQAQIPLNENTALFRAFVEEVAAVWYRLWKCYEGGVSGVNGEYFTALELKGLRPLIRVDATSVAPFSKYAREQTLERLFDKGAITLEEYAQSLDDSSTVPKARLLTIIKNRKEQLDATTKGN